MALYKNEQRARMDEEELERLEAEYRKANGEQPIAIEEEPVPVNKEEETWKERYANLKSYADKTKNELNKKISELERKMNSSPSREPTNMEEVKAWMEKFPDLARVLKGIIREELEYDREELSPRLEELETVKRDIEYARAFNKVLSVHSDFEELIRNPEFIDWVDRQPEEKGKIGELIYKSLRESLDPDDAIRSVTLYKQEMKGRRRKPSEAEAAQSVRPSTPSVPEAPGKRSFSESQVEKMSIREYERLENEIDAAKREGRFVYDLSGAAR